MIKITFHLLRTDVPESTVRAHINAGWGNPIKFSIGLTVKTALWQGDKTKKGYQRLIESKKYPEHSEKNIFIDHFQTKVKNLYQHFVNQNEYAPPKDEFQEVLYQEFKGKKKVPSFFSFIEEFIETSKNRINPKTKKKITEDTIRNFKNCRDKLKLYHKHKNRLGFHNIDIKFYYAFIDYLMSYEYTPNKTYGINTIGKTIKDLKTILIDAASQGIKVNPAYLSNKFVAISEASYSIALDINELNRLYRLKLEPNSMMDKVRDNYIIGAFTGLRHSDWHKVSDGYNEKEGLIYINEIQKTQTSLYIPAHPYVTEVIEKYNGKTPRVYLDTVNTTLPELAQLIPSLRAFDKDALRPKYDLVKSHTARRSFATNQFKQKIPIILIRQITGHKTESSFLKYIKVSRKEYAHMMKEYWQEMAENGKGTEEIEQKILLLDVA